MTDLAPLLAQQACRDLVVAAAAAVDRQDYVGLAALFTADASLTRPDGVQLLGRDAIYQAYAARDPQRLTQHLLCNHVVRLLAPDRASSHCQVLLWSADRASPLGSNGRRADAQEKVGEMQDLLVLGADGWRIAQRQAQFNFYKDSGPAVTGTSISTSTSTSSAKA